MGDGGETEREKVRIRAKTKKRKEMKRKNWDKLRRAFEVIFCCIVTFFVFVMCVYESARVAGAAGWLVGWFVSFVLFGRGRMQSKRCGKQQGGRQGRERKEEGRHQKYFCFSKFVVLHRTAG